MQSNTYTLEEIRQFLTRPVFSFSAVFLVGVLFGLGVHAVLGINQPRERFQEVRNPGKYRFISPLVECENVDTSYSKNIKALEKRISEEIDSLERNDERITDIAYYFRDLNNGPWIAVNPDTNFSPASLVKVPTAITVYKIAEDSPEFLSETLQNPTPDTGKGQNILPEVFLEEGKDYTVAELVEIMLRYSNNRAYELLFEKIAREHSTQVEQVYEDLGIELPIQLREETGAEILSVKEYASFFRILYNATYLNEENSEKLLETLISTTYDQGIVAGLPPGIGTAHKFGERRYQNVLELQLHDCGIVYAEHPYLLCIMTKGTDTAALTEVIQSLSQITHSNFSE